MVDVESEGGVTRIFLNRPEKVNALDSAHLEALLLALQRLEGNQEMRVVVLGGRGKAFCGGADVQELAALNASNAGAFVQRIHEVCAAIRKLPLPVVARLHGAVIGAGLEIAAACDLRIAAEGTRFAMKVDEGARAQPPALIEHEMIAALSSDSRLLVFPLEEVPERPNGGVGVQLLSVPEGEKLAAVLTTDGKSLLVSGIRRKKRAVETMSAKQLAEHMGRRAQRGKLADVGFRPDRLGGEAKEEE